MKGAIMSSNFSWDDLQYFLAVARTGQLSTAARQLRTSHATVSRHIDRLEFGLQVKLFERNPRGYILTNVGQRFIETAERIESETERLRADVSSGATFQRGVVRLSAPEGFANFFFTDHLHDFSKLHPNISLELVTIQQIMALSRKEADVAVVLDEPKAGPYVSEKISDYTLHVYGAKKFLQQIPEITRREQMLDHPFIGYIEDMIFAPGLAYLGEVNKGIRTHFQSSSIFAQLKATRAGQGLCVLPNYIAEQYPDLEIVLPNDIELRRSYYLLYHRDLRNVPRVRTVIQFLRKITDAKQSSFLRGSKR
jgi:DNA-binding transcriptional LysR family regulator